MEVSVPLGRDAVIHDVSNDVVFFLLGDSPVSEFYVPTFRNTLCSIFIDRLID
jgi:hypothetical protein